MPDNRWRVAVSAARTAFLSTIVAAGALCSASALQASVTVPLPVVNPGAEAGSTAGWLNNAANFAAINDPATARDGAWYFEAPAVPAGDGADMWQEVDASAYHGRIENIVLEVSMAADLGTATVTTPTAQYDYVFIALVVMSFRDIDGDPIPFGIGPFIEGDANLSWVDRVTSLEHLNIVQPGLLGSIAYIGLSMGGVWWNTTTDTLAAAAIPQSFHTATPTTVRFDDIRLSVEVPEPTTGLLLALAVLAAARSWPDRSALK